MVLGSGEVSGWFCDLGQYPEGSGASVSHKDGDCRIPFMSVYTVNYMGQSFQYILFV